MEVKELLSGSDELLDFICDRLETIGSACYELSEEFADLKLKKFLIDREKKESTKESKEIKCVGLRTKNKETDIDVNTTETLNTKNDDNVTTDINYINTHTRTHVREFWDFYCYAIKPLRKLTYKRRQKIKTMLKTLSLEEAMMAAYWMRISKYHNGINEHSKEYKDIETLFRHEVQYYEACAELFECNTHKKCEFNNLVNAFRKEKGYDDETQPHTE